MIQLNVTKERSEKIIGATCQNPFEFAGTQPEIAGAVAPPCSEMVKVKSLLLTLIK